MSQSKLNEALEYSNFSASVRNVDVTVKVKVQMRQCFVFRLASTRPEFDIGNYIVN